MIAKGTYPAETSPALPRHNASMNSIAQRFSKSKVPAEEPGSITDAAWVRSRALIERTR